MEGIPPVGKPQTGPTPENRSIDLHPGASRPRARGSAKNISTQFSVEAVMSEGGPGFSHPNPKTMFTYHFSDQTTIPATRNVVFPFFSEAANLARLTPPSLGFKILTPPPITMKEGALIDYTIHLHGIPMRWRTRISRWNPPCEFIDEQLKGPYRTWIHHHSFEETPEGHTLMRDHVEYSLPLPPFSLVVLPFVRAEIQGIFNYRRRVISEEIFQSTP